ncbi:hypothetical protein GCM10027168_69150 [Streptomyces capparidis]
MPREPPVTIATRGEADGWAEAAVPSREAGIGIADSCGGMRSGRGLAVALLRPQRSAGPSPLARAAYTQGMPPPGYGPGARATMKG